LRNDPARVDEREHDQRAEDVRDLPKIARNSMFPRILA
jgi:hypothetical protein